MTEPWYHEAAGPQYFNAWTVTHVLWGAVAARYLPLVTALVLHTLYEAIESELFPAESRDVSLCNHVGDTVGFTAGYLVAARRIP